VGDVCKGIQQFSMQVSPFPAAEGSRAT